MMEQWPLNEEYITQTDATFSDLPQEAVQLAMAILTAKSRGELVRQAGEIVSKYADWQNITALPALIRNMLLVQKYGVQEVEAMRKAGEICNGCGIQLPPALHPLKDRERPEYNLCDECHNKYA